MYKSRIAILTILLTVSMSHGASVTWVSSTQSQPWHSQTAPTLVADSPANPPDVLVVPSKQYQTIDGFGGAFNELGWVALGNASSANRDAVMEALFGATGCDFNLARIPIGASDYATSFYSLDDSPGGDDYTLSNFSIARDQQMLIPYIQAAMAVRPSLQCWGSPWSPPIWMKNTSGTANGYDGGSIRWEPAVLQTYANYLVRWVAEFRAQGINIYGLLPQNEPNQWQVFPSCVWTGPNLRDFIADYLGPTLVASNLNPSVELWFGINGDANNNGHDFNDRIVTVMEDPTANSYITGMGFQYDSQYQIGSAYELYPDKKLMETESRCFESNNSWDDAINRGDDKELFSEMKRHFEKGANAYFAWNMVLDPGGLSTWGWAQNAPITVSNTGQVSYNGEFYVYKHFSHYVKPGAKRVLSFGLWGDQIAFENTDGSIVLVMSNTFTGTQAVTLAVNGWSGNNTINATLPAYSINTFIFTP